MATTFDPTRIWPGAFQKDASVTSAGNPQRQFFTMFGDRYAMDFSEQTGWARGWYQLDTPQDAPYYGHWCNPAERRIVAYCEGDIYVTDCETPEAYRREIASILAWAADLQGVPVAEMRGGIDDHDGQHWANCA